MRARRLATLSFAAALLGGCGACSETTPSAGPATSVLPAQQLEHDRVLVRFVDQAPACDFEHRGQLVDLGGATGKVRLGPASATASRLELEGADWLSHSSSNLTFKFVLPEPQNIFLAAHIAPREARGVSLLVDGMLLGSSRFKRGDKSSRVVETKPTSRAFDAGEHEVSLRFSGPRGEAERALIDWVRIGFPDELSQTYGPPTMADVLMPGAALAKVPHRAFSLRLPGLVRCAAHVQPRTRLRTAVGLLGAGEAEAEIVARVEGEPPVSLQRVQISGGDTASWTDIDLNLEAFAGKTVFFEFAGRTGTSSSRVLFGDPEIITTTVAPPTTPATQIVVLVVLSGVDMEELPGYADRPTPGLDNLVRLSERATIFRAHRANTVRVTGSLATMLTAVPADRLTLSDLGGALPEAVPTVASLGATQHALTAIFSGVPHSFRPFGLDRGFQTVVEHSPVAGDGKLPLQEAAAWLVDSVAKSADSRHLLVVHARGAHPPWVIDQKQLDLMPPDTYTGDISPRRAAQQLARLRGRMRLYELQGADQVRLTALHHAALQEQDRALGNIFSALTDAGLDDKALLVVTADVASGLSQLFDETPPLEEPRLALPLYVVFPGGQHAHSEVTFPTEALDVGHTLFRAMGIQPPDGTQGRDLMAVASGLPLPLVRPSLSVANDARLARFGEFVLSPNGKLCAILIDPTCRFDQRPLNPLIAQFIERSMSQELAERPANYPRNNAQIDDATLSAMRVWGAME